MRRPHAEGDIAARERVEAELRRVSEQFRIVADSVPIHLLHLDRDERVLFANKAAAEMWQCPAEALVGKTIRDIAGEEAQRALRPYTERVLRGETVAYESPFLAPDGSIRTFLNTYSPDRAPDGTVRGFIATGTDITDRKHAEEELKRTAQFREQFIGILGHDLRNPLSAIRASADLMLRQEDLKPGLLKGLTRIRGSAERMSRMISDLLDFARGRLGGGIPLQRKPVNLHELCHRVVDELHVAHPDRQLVFEAEGNGLGEWDPDRVAQALSNLVGNALQHGAADAPVYVRVKDGSEGVLLEVTNQGRPIPQALLPVIFEPFRGASVTAGHEGPKSLGLGLYIVQEIVRAHGGKVEVRSTEREGTVFSVVWPRVAPAGPMR